ncbi:MAG: hypothetical protein Kow00117_23360 [Phototrophicales bacterium]|nr:MAG: hypothetical protein CUN56_05050 [Phototrophicales bacterium]RMG73407.1 MAG: hypothetical protein D6711_10865 [Chloroflexota bacterium]
MAIEFYDVKLKKKVQIDEANVRKTTFTTKNGQTRYGLRAKTDDGRNLTKFVSKGDWDALNVPQE